MRGAVSLAAGLVALTLTPAANAATPILEKTVVVQPVTGKVRVKAAGEPRARTLRAARAIPTGSFIDATRGKVRVITAGAETGKRQTGTFDGGAFVVKQERSALTTLLLASTRSIASVCGAATGKAAASKPLPPKVIRALHGSAKGKFRTQGRYAAATVRGTVWDTIDRCDGTVTTAIAGVVDTSTGAQTFQVAAGTSVIAYCFPPGSAFKGPEYCTAVIQQPANGIFGWGMGTRADATTYDVCIRAPDGREGCARYPLSAPDATNLRVGAVVCQQGRLGGPGTYRVRWFVNGQQLGPPLSFTATLQQPSFGPDCQVQPAAEGGTVTTGGTAG